MTHSEIMIVDVALRVLNRRLLTLLALGMTFGLFCWAMALGSWLHFAIAGAFGVAIFLPILVGERTKERPREQENSE